ncbi:MAG: hypothetical protein QW701_00815 [Candidatus Nezhaarchaeales archaeon]
MKHPAAAIRHVAAGWGSRDTSNMVGKGINEKGVGSAHGRRPMKETIAENISPPIPKVIPKHPSFLLTINAKTPKSIDQNTKLAIALTTLTSVKASTINYLTE